MSAGNDRGFIDHLQDKERSSKVMKCPLFEVAYLMKGTGIEAPDSRCLKEECAWWDRIQEKCGILSLSHDVHWLVGAAQQIRDKMPHE